jgi:cyanophycinase
MTRGYILLEGGAEFGGRMAEPDRRALELAGGSTARVCIIPAAAAPDNNHDRAGQIAERWFRQLGAGDVAALPVTDRPSADDPYSVALLARSHLIYLLGGFPGHLHHSLNGSRGWQALLAAHGRGAVVAGSSAGAMVLCARYYDPDMRTVATGLGMVKGACVVPHHDTFGKTWAPRLAKQLPETILLGIDEETGTIDDGPDNVWQVYGKGAVTLYHRDRQTVFSVGECFALPRS